MIEPLVNEYSLEEEKQIARNKLLFYNYVYFLRGVPVYVGKGYGRRVKAKFRHREFMEFEERMRLEGDTLIVQIVFAHDVEEVVLSNEIALISSIGRIDLGNGPLFNKTCGGEGTAGRIMPPRNAEWCRKISEAKKGKPNPRISQAKLGKPNLKLRGRIKSPEERRKISESKLGKPINVGVPKSEEHRKNLSLAKMGKPNPSARRPHTLEHRNKVRDSRLGTHASEETRRKMSATRKGRPATRLLYGPDNPFFGKHHSPESIQKMRESKMRMRNSETLELF